MDTKYGGPGLWFDHFSLTDGPGTQKVVAVSRLGCGLHEI